MTFSSSDVTPKGFGYNSDGFWGAEMHNMSGSCGGGMVVNNSGSQEELMLCQKVLQAGAVNGDSGDVGEGEEEGGR